MATFLVFLSKKIGFDMKKKMIIIHNLKFLSKNGKKHNFKNFLPKKMDFSIHLIFT